MRKFIGGLEKTWGGWGAGIGEKLVSKRWTKKYNHRENKIS